MRIALLCAVVLGALAVTAQASTGFQSPSGNIGCFIGKSGVRCDIRTRDWSPPPKPASCGWRRSPEDLAQESSLPRR